MCGGGFSDLFVFFFSWVILTFIALASYFYHIFLDSFAFFLAFFCCTTVRSKEVGVRGELTKFYQKGNPLSSPKSLEGGEKKL